MMKLLSLLFFSGTILYEELLLRRWTGTAFSDYHTAMIACFSLVYGTVTWLGCSLLPTNKARTLAAGCFTFIMALLFSVHATVYGFFKTYFELGMMLSMGGDVAGQFAGETLSAISGTLPFILLSLIPCCLLVMLRRIILTGLPRDYHLRMRSLFAAVILDSLLIVPMVMGSTFPADRDAFLSDYTAAGAIPRFGAVTAARLEAIYSLTGLPEDFLDYVPPVVTETPAPTPVVYPYNQRDIDFAALAEAEDNKTLRSMHKYFGSMAPTRQNEYTGRFAGKNLVFLVCEAFCPYVIDPELTPTLYRLYSEGFQFTNFYQPDWTQSTFGGEFAAVTGIVPTWVTGGYSFTATADNAMPFALGNQLRSKGYVTGAFHNHYAAYYGRMNTHPNLGYDFKAISLGLKLPTNGWPRSDLEMLEATMPKYIEDYVNEGLRFHTYYMTVSGHTAYNFHGNKMAKRHKDEVAHLDYSENVRAYLACQLEVEYALTYLLEQLEAAGIADDTVIALTSDHYPYALSHNFSKDLYNELSGKKTTERDMERFRNSFLLWCGDMSEPVVIDDPCSTIDIVPTLSNLFGLSYDSRLLSGRDILSDNYDVSDPNSRMPFVVFADNGAGISWISPVGEYNAFKGKFTPAEGYEADEAYIEAMHRKAKNMFKYARSLVIEDYYAEVLE